MGDDAAKPDFRYWAFISYSHSDETFAAELHQAIETYRVPKALVGRAHSYGEIPRRLMPVFRDRDELPGASNLAEKIYAALAVSRFLIVICSPRSAVSQYVNEEIQEFKRLGRADRVLPVIFEGAPHASSRPGREGEECFPHSLCHDVDADGTTTTCEPMAADARPGKDGRQRAVLKLIAGMLEVGFDDLYRREVIRQRRRRVRIGAVSAAVAAMLIVGLVAGGRYVARSQASSVVNELASAEVEQAPRILDAIKAHRRWALPMLKDESTRGSPGSPQELNWQLALLWLGEGDAVALRDRLTTGTAEQFVVVRDVLERHYASGRNGGGPAFKAVIVEPLWSVALDGLRPIGPRFQAACALARFAPGDVRWHEVREWVSDYLATRAGTEFMAWRTALEPVHKTLWDSLESIFERASEPQQSRLHAAEALAEYASNRPDALFDLLARGEEFQFPVLFEKLTRHRGDMVRLARRELAKRPDEAASDEEKESLARRQANAAIALYRLDSFVDVWPTLQSVAEPRVRTYVIHGLSSLGGDPDGAIRRLNVEEDANVKQALLLALGEFTQTQLATERRSALKQRLKDIYLEDANAGVHSAARWLLRRWAGAKELGAADKQLLDERGLALPALEPRRWFVNSQGQTLVVIERGDFEMGSPATELGHNINERQHRRRFSGRFAIGTTEVTNAQFRRFQRDEKARDPFADGELQKYVRTEDSPQTGVSWFEAAWYCNWLSRKEGLSEEQLCYRPNQNGRYGPGMQAKENYLELPGYRLPTEAEWEFACRAATTASRPYGATEALLPEYAWYGTNGQNRVWPVASLKPNDWGLFDMLGNALEWCHDEYGDYPDPGADGVLGETVDDEPVTETSPRVLRGGSFYHSPLIIRSAARYSYQVDQKYERLGFRVAKTLP